MSEVYPGLEWMDIIAIILSTLCQFISGKRFYQVNRFSYLDLSVID